MKIPKGMLKAAREEVHTRLREGRSMLEPSAGIDYVQVVLETALRWQKNNPPMPQKEQVGALVNVGLNASAEFGGYDLTDAAAWSIATEWVRRMYDELEPLEDTNPD